LGKVSWHYGGWTQHDRSKRMPKMSDGRRRTIQAKQRKADNARRRAAKLAKRERNAGKAAAGASPAR
jgi:hypothetical protein